MSYNVYKNCDDTCFEELKVKLAVLNDKILSQFKGVLTAHIRFDDADFLGLNFEIKDSDTFGSNLALLFEDLPGNKTFEVGLVKTYDEKNYRYSIKMQILQNTLLEFIESNYYPIISNAIEKFNSITMEEIICGNKIELSL